MDEAFADVEGLAAACRFNDCSHSSEPGCAVNAALASGELTQERYESWRKLQRELRAIAIRAGRKASPRGEAEVDAAGPGRARSGAAALEGDTSVPTRRLDTPAGARPVTNG